MSRPVHTYNNGQPYVPARGRSQIKPPVEQHQIHHHPILRGTPSTVEFIRKVKRELKIRGYAFNTISSYINNIAVFLRWFGAAPHKVTIEDVRNFLEMLVDGGIESSTLAGHLSAIRTCFDKFCGRDVTLGLVTPRRKKTQPIVLSPAEVQRVLAAAPNLTIKMAIGIMYAAGLRNKELCSLRVRDLDFERKTIRVEQSKGRSDRLVMLPQTFAGALQQLYNNSPGEQFLFPSLTNRKDRYMSPRTLQRWVKLSVELAGLKHSITPHSFRHAFATHLLENGTDIRFIQKLLGHARLETTTIYTRVAQIKTQAIVSPLDHHAPKPPQLSQASSESRPAQPTVGKLTLAVVLRDDKKSADVDLKIIGQQTISLPGIQVRQNDHQWMEINLPSSDVWQSQLSQLPIAQRDRIADPEFFEFLRSQISRRFLKLLNPG